MEKQFILIRPMKALSGQDQCPTKSLSARIRLFTPGRRWSTSLLEVLNCELFRAAAVARLGLSQG